MYDQHGLQKINNMSEVKKLIITRKKTDQNGNEYALIFYLKYLIYNHISFW